MKKRPRKKPREPRRDYSAAAVFSGTRRVLRLVDGYLAKQDRDKLISDGLGLMTWGELRSHVQAARRLRIRSPA